MSADDPLASTETLRGVLVRTLFRSEDERYTVALLRPDEPGRSQQVVAGNLGGCEVGDEVELQGAHSRHPRHGERFRVVQARWLPPRTREGIERYLSGGAVDGIGKALAERIVAKFGAETWRVLDDSPQRLAEVEGIGSTRAASIVESWRRSRRGSEERAFLATLGLGPVLTERVLEELGEEASRIVRRNPYLLARRVEGIGFVRADEIARRLQIESDAPQRIGAGLWQVLSAESEQGHLYTPRDRPREPRGRVAARTRGAGARRARAPARER